jgi:small-conductance mechanosensitive channel/CRP-like cAMP-binding protein
MQGKYLEMGWGVTTNALILIFLAFAISLIAIRVRNERQALSTFLIKLVVVGTVTAFMLGQNVLPIRTDVAGATALRRTLESTIQVIWWLLAAWLAVGFLRAFVVLGRKPSESKLAQDLLAALIYLVAFFAIVTHVFDVPVKGLLATSGAVAIILGLALQSSLADVFSGIVLNVERPYHVGDWVVLDDGVEGTVIETNWRSTHILTGSQDVAVVPNSVVAKGKLINCSSPSKVHGATTRIRLEGSIAPAVGTQLLKEVLLGSSQIMRIPEPTVAIKEVSADMIDFELAYAVSAIALVDDAQSEIYDRVFRAVAAGGIRFASRVGVSSAPKISPADHVQVGPENLLLGISLFSVLTQAERAELATQMVRRDYKPGDVVVRSGNVVASLNIISDGVLVATEDLNGRVVERLRLTPGVYFGETGLLTGQPLNGDITALTRVVIYEISRDALCPLLQARPSMAEELSELLANRQRARLTVLDQFRVDEPHSEGFAIRLAEKIRAIFLPG